MCKLCSRDIVADKKTNAKLTKLLHRIVSKLKPQKVFLFGSMARGDVSERSDADLLIVGRFEEGFFERMALVSSLNNTGLEVDSLVYTEDEFNRMKEEGRPLIRNVLSEGLLVYSA